MLEMFCPPPYRRRMSHVVSCAVAQALLLLVPHPDTVANRAHGDTVITRALLVLSQRVNDVRVLSPVEVRTLFERAGAGAPPAALTAFRLRNDATIYVSGTSAVYRDAAEKPSAFHLLRLAATLVHEQVHDTDGEDAAYRRQADFVRSRLAALPRDERARGYQYWHALEVRAISMAKALAHRR
jgi:hypothetical protein